MQKATCICVPLWQGAEKQGPESAPQALLDSGADKILQRYFDTDFVTLPAIKEQITPHNKYAVLARYMQRLKHTVSDSIAHGAFPFILGGDHALGLGSVAGASEHYDNLGLIWFDAHGDMNTEATSPTGHIHGMPIAALMGLCASDLNNVATRRIKPENIFWIGTRSLDRGEKELIERMQLHVYTTEEVRTEGMSHIMERVRKDILQNGISHLHCSVDIDAMDPTIVTATGVAEPDGLMTDEYKQFADLLPELPVRLTSLDFVEYNPLLDDETQSTRQWCLNAIDYLIKAISGK